MSHIEGGPAVVIAAAQLDGLIASLRSRGYEVIAPTVRGGAIDLAPIENGAELPAGWADEQEAGSYRLVETDGRAVFGISNGPASWKRYLHPPRARLWHADLSGDVPVYESDAAAGGAKMAFLGVRACDLASIRILDKVLGDDEHYAARRAGTIVIAVNCGQAGATCFCTSMGTGPGAADGFDLALTEFVDGDRHEFLVEIGSERGAALAGEIASRVASADDRERGRAVTERTAGQMGRTLDTDGLPGAIAAAAESPRWQDVAERCLTCGNCTMVCPTCYCTEMSETTDLTGEHAERWREWESCFSLDFSHLTSGSVRHSPASRYRQWLTHKLSTWVDQFGSMGCVGCGRCITWCPVGIDITEEAAALAQEGAT